MTTCYDIFCCCFGKREEAKDDAGDYQAYGTPERGKGRTNGERGGSGEPLAPGSVNSGYGATDAAVTASPGPGPLASQTDGTEVQKEKLSAIQQKARAQDELIASLEERCYTTCPQLRPATTGDDDATELDLVVPVFSQSFEGEVTQAEAAAAMRKGRCLELTALFQRVAAARTGEGDAETIRDRASMSSRSSSRSSRSDVAPSLDRRLTKLDSRVDRMGTQLETLAGFIDHELGEWAKLPQENGTDGEVPGTAHDGEMAAQHK